MKDIFRLLVTFLLDVTNIEYKAEMCCRNVVKQLTNDGFPRLRQMNIPRYLAACSPDMCYQIACEFVVVSRLATAKPS